MLSPLRELTCHMESNSSTCHPAEAASPALTLIKDERLNRSEPMHVNDLLRVATVMPAIPGGSLLSRPSASLVFYQVVQKQWGTRYW